MIFNCFQPGKQTNKPTNQLEEWNEICLWLILFWLVLDTAARPKKNLLLK